MKSGFVLVDKPIGISSFVVVRRCRKVFNTKKVGHAGTLDPQASGLLLVAIGQATRLIRFLDLEPKGYEFEIVFGVQTNTDDDAGELVEQSDSSHITLESIQEKLPEFTGQISQKPPLFSAIHIDGVRAYKKARKGEEFEIPSREVNVFSLDCVDFKDGVATCHASVSSGTYIRSLARDIGLALGTHGHARSIRRTNLSDLVISDAVPLKDLSQDRLVDAHEVLELPTRTIDADELAAIRMGQRVKAECGPVGEFQAFVFENCVLGVGERMDDDLQPRVVFPALEETEN